MRLARENILRPGAAVLSVADEERHWVQDDQSQNDSDGVEEVEPLPKFPRNTLKVRISDGTHHLDAIEYRSTPELTLGETPLGYKVSRKFSFPHLYCNLFNFH